jgi:hypothetical protein
MRDKGDYRVNIGGASIVLLLMVLSLTIYAVLSIRVSYHERKLAEKTTEVVEEYYLADAQAEEILMQVYEVLEANQNTSTMDHEKLYAELRKLNGITEVNKLEEYVSFQVKINKNANIKVELDLNLTDEDMGPNVHYWKMVNTEDGDYESKEIEIWDGIIEK